MLDAGRELRGFACAGVLLAHRSGTTAAKTSGCDLVETGPTFARCSPEVSLARTAFDPGVTAAIEGALVLLMAATLRVVVRPVRSGCGPYRVLPSFPINVSLGDDQPDGNSDARRVRGRSRLTAGLDVPARARAHARHPGADAWKRFEVDAEARRELEPGRARAVGD